MLLQKIKLTNLLSFGPDGMELELRPLNVLIGPNGSGKSNLIEAISLLQAAPTNVLRPIREGGGIRDWTWKGNPGTLATIEARIPLSSETHLIHKMEVGDFPWGAGLWEERIYRYTVDSPSENVIYERSEDTDDVAKALASPFGANKWQDVKVTYDRSVLSQLKDFNNFPEVSCLGELYARIHLYREWSFGRQAALRQPQKADQPNEFLEPDCANLGLVLNRLRGDPTAKHNILENLKALYEGIEDYDVSVVGGTVQVFFHESGLKEKIPATRLSDGTLRYLCLLAILCDPNPPPLICIEEPELGLHPDIMPTLYRLLRDASQRTQMIVTTHSDGLVDEFTDDPESVVVCEKEKMGTVMKRLNTTDLKEWLERYSLGKLWTKGELGGVRW
jgi:predicted ATPase